jgi:hypothetical protein
LDTLEPVPPPAFDREGTVASCCEATTDWAEDRPSLVNEIGCTRRSISSR